MLEVAVVPADVQDPDAAPRLLCEARRLFPWLERLFADGGYAGPRLASALGRSARIRLKIIKRLAGSHGFAVLPRRGVIERTFSWLHRHRRLACHYEAYAAMAVGFIKPAMIALMLRRFTSAISA